MLGVELRCQRHLHGIAIGDVIEVRCRECAKLRGEPVIHRWRITGSGAELLQDEDGGGEAATSCDGYHDDQHG